MHVCYVDEAGCTGVLQSANSPVQPAFVLAGVAVSVAAVRPLTGDFLRLKRAFFPSAFATCPQFLDGVRFEIKGSELRKNIAKGSSAERRHAIGFLDKTRALLTAHGARVFGRIWVKGIGAPFDGTAVYTYSMQDICTTFQQMLWTSGTSGFVIADSRTKPMNSNVAHSIFTQKFRTTGDPFDRIVEMPTFGHSDNHVGLQLADLLCSAFLYPMTVHAYCSGHVENVHVRPGYGVFGPRYGGSLKALQHRYQDGNGRWRGGLTVSDALGQRSGALLFR
jgi:hypothetical protein